MGEGCEGRYMCPRSHVMRVRIGFWWEANTPPFPDVTQTPSARSYLGPGVFFTTGHLGRKGRRPRGCRSATRLPCATGVGQGPPGFSPWSGFSTSYCLHGLWGRRRVACHSGRMGTYKGFLSEEFGHVGSFLKIERRSIEVWEKAGRARKRAANPTLGAPRPADQRRPASGSEDWQ